MKKRTETSASIRFKKYIFLNYKYIINHPLQEYRHLKYMLLVHLIL